MLGAILYDRRVSISPLGTRASSRKAKCILPKTVRRCHRSSGRSMNLSGACSRVFGTASACVGTDVALQGAHSSAARPATATAEIALLARSRNPGAASNTQLPRMPSREDTRGSWWRRRPPLASSEAAPVLACWRATAPEYTITYAQAGGPLAGHPNGCSFLGQYLVICSRHAPVDTSPT